MNHPENKSRHILRRVVTVGLVAVPLLSGGAFLYAQPASDFLPQITIVEIMDSMVMPSAQLVWDAVAYDVTAAGETITGPKTDEDWQKLRWSAVALAETANNLAVPGELAPEKIQALIEANRGAWIGHTHVLYEAAMQAVRAVDAKDPAQVSDAGGTIDTACESCHLQFWYPDQK
jgi:hypothetical protein